MKCTNDYIPCGAADNEDIPQRERHEWNLKIRPGGRAPWFQLTACCLGRRDQDSPWRLGSRCSKAEPGLSPLTPHPIASVSASAVCFYRCCPEVKYTQWGLANREKNKAADVLLQAQPFVNDVGLHSAFHGSFLRLTQNRTGNKNSGPVTLTKKEFLLVWCSLFLWNS